MGAANRHILIIDDQPDIGEALQVALTMEGFQAAVAHDRQAALTLLGDTPPAVILLDYHMPGLNAQEFVGRLRARGITAPIVLMTGSEDAREQAQQLGVRHILRKPFELDDMIELVRVCLQPPPAHQGVP